MQKERYYGGYKNTIDEIEDSKRDMALVIFRYALGIIAVFVLIALY